MFSLMFCLLKFSNVQVSNQYIIYPSLTCATINCQNVLVQIIVKNIQQDRGKPTNKQKQTKKCNFVSLYWTLVLD